MQGGSSIPSVELKRGSQAFLRKQCCGLASLCGLMVNTLDGALVQCCACDVGHTCAGCGRSGRWSPGWRRPIRTPQAPVHRPALAAGAGCPLGCLRDAPVACAKMPSPPDSDPAWPPWNRATTLCGSKACDRMRSCGHHPCHAHNVALAATSCDMPDSDVHLQRPGSSP